MPDSQSAQIQSPPTPGMHFPRTAALWSLALLGGMAIAVRSTVDDRTQRPQIERILQNTSVGDTRYYSPQAQGADPLAFAGEPLVLAGTSPDPMPDSRMLLVGETDSTRFRLYVPSDRAANGMPNGNDTLGGPSWFLKTGPGQFLKVTR
ncbi:MAG: hypothetical protein RLZZ244_1233 [Verrucomicrobiota bacterium]|jgi:hypothetical protein